MLSKKMILNEAANSGFVRPLSDDEREKLKKFKKNTSLHDC